MAQLCGIINGLLQLLFRLSKCQFVFQDFVIQGGDPSGTGKGGESIYGRQFNDEIHPQLRHTGAVSFKKPRDERYQLRVYYRWPMLDQIQMDHNFL